MNLLIFPEYAYPCNHVVVETVYEKLLPHNGNLVHMIRPMAGVTEVGFGPTPEPNLTQVVFPAEPFYSPLQNVLRASRKRRWALQALQLLADIPFEAVLVRNDLVYAQTAMRWARKRRVPFVFQISSPDAEFRINQGRKSRSIMGLYSILKGLIDLSMRRWLCRRADAVLAISSAMRDYMLKADGLDAVRCFSFPMGFNDQFVNDSKKVEEIRRQLELPSGKTIIYSGTIDPLRSPQWMVNVLAKVRGEIPGAILLILAKEANEVRARFEKEIVELRHAVRIIGPLHHSEVGLHLQCADVMLSPIPPILEYKMSSPTKVLEALGVGLPVVGNEEVAEHFHILQDSGGGIAVPYDVTAFAEAITSLLRDQEKRRRMGEKGRQWVLKHRTYSRLTEYLEDILRAAGSRSALARLPTSPDYL